LHRHSQQSPFDLSNEYQDVDVDADIKGPLAEVGFVI